MQRATGEMVSVVMVILVVVAASGPIPVDPMTSGAELGGLAALVPTFDR